MCVWYLKEICVSGGLNTKYIDKASVSGRTHAVSGGKYAVSGGKAPVGGGFITKYVDEGPVGELITKCIDKGPVSGGLITKYIDSRAF